MTITSDYQRDWPKYFDAVADQGPRDTLLRALAAWEAFPGASSSRLAGEPPLAIDVACGEGRDTRELLARGWRVFAFDATPLAIERLMARTKPLPHGEASRLTTRVLSFEKLPGFTDWPARADLINASFALPFCPPAFFPAVWARLVGTLAPGGLFAGQIFGDRDEWASVRPASHYTRERMLALFSGFEFVHLEEVEKDGSDALAQLKHHHLFHIVARKMA